MRFFKKLSGRANSKPGHDTGPMPARALKLQYTPAAENGDKFADQYRSAVKENEHIELDYSVKSLQFVDNFLQRFRDEGLTVNDFAETIFAAGCYVGQVMINNNQGQWINSEDANLPDGVRMMPIVIKLPNGKICDPIGKAFKRFYHGESDSLQYFHHVFTN